MEPQHSQGWYAPCGVQPPMTVMMTVEQNVNTGLYDGLIMRLYYDMIIASCYVSIVV